MSIGASTLRASTRLGWSRTLLTGALVAGAAISVVSLLSIAGTDRLGWDFRYTYFHAAALVMDGRSPYPPVDDAVLASGIGYVYPPQFVVALAPVTELPTDLVVWIAFAAGVAAALGALAVLGVRDLRCYAAFLAWGSTSNALELTNLSAFLVLGIAVVWRFRSTTWPLAATLGLVVSTKLFGWPLFVWAAATRRYRAALLAIVVGVTVTASAWAIIGFDGLMQYPELLRRFSEVQGETNSYSILAVSVALGLGSAAGQVLGSVVGCALLAASAYYGRWASDDVRCFAAAIGATLAFSPVLWVHFFVLLAVPLAIARPRFSVVWLLPIALWACPRGGNGDDLQVLLPAAVTLLILAVILIRPEERRAPYALEVGS